MITNPIFRTAQALLIVVILAAAAPAVAEITVSNGVLKGSGTGEIWAYGQGQTTFQLHGDGRLIIRHTDDNQVVSNGNGTRIVDGSTITFLSYTGTIGISGDHIVAYYDGKNAEIVAKGDQRVILCGEGTYDANGDQGNWDDYGTTVVMGSPSIDDDDLVWGESSEYEAQTIGAVRDIQTFPVYKEWADEYPDAARELPQTRDYYAWCASYPVAVAALYNHPRWEVWVAARPRLVAFVNYHNTFFLWYDSHPTFQPYFHHPVFYHAFIHRHPAAFNGVTVDITIGDWCDQHPVEARALETQVIIQNKLVVKNKTVIKNKSINVHDLWQGKTSNELDAGLKNKGANRIDLKNDSRIDKSDTKLLGDVRNVKKGQNKAQFETTISEPSGNTDARKTVREQERDANRQHKVAENAQKDQEKADERTARESRQVSEQVEKQRLQEERRQATINEKIARDQAAELDRQQRAAKEEQDRQVRDQQERDARAARDAEQARSRQPQDDNRQAQKEVKAQERMGRQEQKAVDKEAKRADKEAQKAEKQQNKKSR